MVIDIINALELVEKTSGTNEKIKILIDFCSENKEQGKQLKELLFIALSPDFKTHIGKGTARKLTELLAMFSPTQKNVDDFTNETDAYNHFIDLMNKANSGEISGNEYAGAVMCNLLSFKHFVDEKIAVWLLRVVSKDMRIGVSIKNFFKIWTEKEDNLKPVALMSCEDTYKLNEHVDGLNANIENWYMQEKLDGFRYAIVIKDNTVQYISRNGKIKQGEAFPTITAELMKSHDILNGYVLDCELVSTDWNETATVINSTKNVRSDEKLTVNVFDILTVEEFYSQKCEKLLVDRIKILVEKIKQNDKIKFPEFLPCKNTENIWAYFNKIVSNNGEGLILKNMQSLYEFKRSKQWLKLKQIASVDVKCTEAIEGTGKYKGKLGAITVELENGLFCNVGSGFTKEQVEYFWDNKSEIVGKIIEVEYRQKTKDGNLRHPVFLRVRFDK